MLEKMERKRGYLLRSHKLLKEKDVDFLRKYEELYSYIMTREGKLSIKTKELIAITLLASRGFYEAMRLHVRRAMRYGVTKEEIIEALQVSMLYSGAPSLLYGLEKIIEEFVNK